MQTRFIFAFLAICLIFSIHTIPSQATAPTSSGWVMEKAGIQVQKNANSIKKLAAGNASSCLITDEGTVQCWGKLVGSVGKSNVPKTVEGLDEGVTAISLSNNKNTSYACALLKNGRLKCWGDNSSGQLGDGTLQDRSIPQNVVALDEIVTAVSAGTNHTCALLSNGVVKCWGSNYSGQLGQKNISLSAVPIEVTGLNEEAKAITVGSNHSCALLRSGQIKCWGANNKGQLGNGTISSYQNDLNDLVVVVGLAGEVKNLVSGENHTCVILNNGQMQCWGSNEDGQAGIVHNSSGLPNTQPTPAIVQNLPGKVMFANAGMAHSCAVIEDGSIYCWGTNSYGQLGIGKINQTLGSPKPVALPFAAADLALGNDHTCALSADKTVWCWGNNVNGQAGENLRLNHASATLPSAAKYIASSRSHTCVIVQQDDVYCWLASIYDYGPNDEIKNADYATKISALPSSIQAISVGNNFTCAAPKSGGVLCWGLNTNGELGNQKQLSSTVPITVDGITENVIALTSGTSHTCALTEDGKVKCWGNNPKGQVSPTDRSKNLYTATQVTPLPEVTQITTSDNFSCALSVSGAVYCWGGASTTTSGVVQIPSLSESGVALGSSDYDTCVLLTDGSIKCWEIKSRGETEAANATQFTTPKPVSWLKEAAIKMSIGTSAKCAQTNARMICKDSYDFQDRIEGFDGDELGMLSGRCLLTKQGAILGCGYRSNYYNNLYLPQKVALKSKFPFKLFVPQLLIKRFQKGE